MKYNELGILGDMLEYIKSTYNQHYVGGDGQAQLFDHFTSQENEIFCRMNAVKYLLRFGKKAGRNQKDLDKALHYSVLAKHFSQQQDKELAEKAPVPNYKVANIAPPSSVSGTFLGHMERR